MYTISNTRNCQRHTNSLKSELIILSLSPLFVLTLIKNYKFSVEFQDWTGFVGYYAWLIMILGICVLGIIAAIIILFRFKIYRTFACTDGYEITITSIDSDSGLNYLLTFILPLIFDDLNCWQNCLVFLLIIILIISLIYKTNLFYANPVLTVLGYKIIYFKFKEPPKTDGLTFEGELIGICPKGIDGKRVISFKHISDNVLCIKQRRR